MEVRERRLPPATAATASPITLLGAVVVPISPTTNSPGRTASDEPDELWCDNTLVAALFLRCGSRRQWQRRWGDRRARKWFIGGIVFVLMLVVLTIYTSPFASGGNGRQQAALAGDIGRDPAMFVRQYSRWSAYYIAANLYNNEDLLPSYIQALETLMRDILLPALSHDATKIFVSVMSNGNTDRTAEIIDTDFVAMLQRVGVRHSVRSNESCCSAWAATGGTSVGDETGSTAGTGYGKRPANMSRIDWMACIRNAAMRPFYEQGVTLFGSSGGSAVAAGGRDVAVLFFNDIFFRPADIADLLTTNDGAVDLACGMDFYYAFYDTWVTRDVDGTRFDPWPPYAAYPATQRAIAAKREAPVRCCWNGVALLRGSVFLAEAKTNPTRRAIRFRSNTSDDPCYASECQHLCSDMLLNGLDRIYLNPRVRVTYEQYYDTLQHHSWWYSHNLLTWAMGWARVWRWPAFYGGPPTLDSLAPGGVQCIAVEDTFTTPAYQVIAMALLFMMASCVACNLPACKRCATEMRQRMFAQRASALPPDPVIPM
jgi:hypothetical protein